MTANPTLNPALRDFWRQPARIRVLYGGRSSSKSWDAAGFAVFLAQRCKIRVLCTRQFQNKIEESVYSLLKIQIDRFGLRDQFTILNNKIIHNHTGSEFIFYGLSRNIDEIKSMESIDIHWAEEAHLMTKEQWDIIDPTLRKQGSQHWIIFNPRLITDFVWRRFVVNPPPNTVVRKINYDENPFLSETMLQVIEAAKEEDEDNYRHIYLGEPLQDDESVIIKRSWILAAVDAHKTLGIVPRGRRRVGWDVADDGPDQNALVDACGPLALEVMQWKGGTDELPKSAKRVWTVARAAKAEIYYDNIGVGAFAGGHFTDLNRGVCGGWKPRHKGFGAGEKVIRPDRIYARSGIKNKDFFSNLKAQAWWEVADRFRNTYNAIHKGMKFKDDQLIFISSDLEYSEQLIDELSTPKQDYDAAGRVKVESKKDLDKRDIASPNLADAFVIAYNPNITSAINYNDLL